MLLALNVSQNTRYKLYKDGKFFDMENDILESHLEDKDLNEDQKIIKAKLSELAGFHRFQKAPL